MIDQAIDEYKYPEWGNSSEVRRTWPLIVAVLGSLPAHTCMQFSSSAGLSRISFVFTNT